MIFEIITLFPKFFASFFKTGMMTRAVCTGVIDYHIVGMRKYGQGRLKKVDDTPYGGGAGMLIKKSVLERSLGECEGEYVIFLSPRGKMLDHNILKRLARKKSLTIVCGHYEGVDQRFVDQYTDEEISIGDYVLSGGESAALVLMEGISRYLDGFMGNPCSYQNESFENLCLEHDQYTKPFSSEMPKILVSGDHRRIEEWKRVNALINTYRKRPDFLKNKTLSYREIDTIKKYFYCALSRPRKMYRCYSLGMTI